MTDIEKLFEQNKELIEKMDALEVEFKEQSKLSAMHDQRIERLIYLLEGDKADPSRGFINRLISLENFASTVKDTKAYLMGNIAMAIFIITAIGWLIGFLFKAYYFFKGQ